MSIAVAHLRNTFLFPSETFIYGLIANQVRYNPVVFTRKVIHPELFPVPKIVSIKPPKMESGVLEYWWYTLTRRSQTFTTAIKKENIRLIHAHFGPEGVYALPLAQAFGLPLVVSFYGHDVMELPHSPGRKPTYWNYYFHLKELAAKADLFLAFSPSYYQELLALGFAKEKIELFHLGVDLTRFHFIEPKERESLNILMVGRLVEKKGFEYGLGAFAKMHQKFPRAKMTIIGDGPLKDILQQKAGELQLGEAVCFTGLLSSSKIAEHMAKADILLAPSVTTAGGDKEGTLAVLAEAGATGLSSVASWHGGIPETIIDGKTGLLCPEADIEALSKALCTLAENPGLRAEMGKAAHDHIAKEFNIKTQADRLEKIYDRLLLPPTIRS